MADETAKPNENKRNLTVKVFTPRNPSDIRKFIFDKHMTVGAAAKEAAKDFGYKGGKPTFAKDGTVLDRTKQLAEAGVRDGDTLEIVDASGGV